MEISVVSTYKRLLSHIADIIDVSGYRNDYIAKKIGLKPQNFSVKKQKASWTPDELEKLLKIIDNDDVEDYLMMEHMRSLKGEETVTLDEFKKQMGWK